MSRLTTRLLAAALAASMGLGGVAVQAQPRPGDPGGPGAGPHNARPANQHRGGPRHNARPAPRPGPQAERGVGPDRNWVRGSRVPPQYRTHQVVVDNWREHRLPPPPRGQHWVQNGADYLLIGIATGVIASIVYGSTR